MRKLLTSLAAVLLAAFVLATAAAPAAAATAIEYGLIAALADTSTSQPNDQGTTPAREPAEPSPASDPAAPSATKPLP